MLEWIQLLLRVSVKNTKILKHIKITEEESRWGKKLFSYCTKTTSLGKAPQNPEIIISPEKKNVYIALNNISVKLLTIALPELLYSMRRYKQTGQREDWFVVYWIGSLHTDPILIHDLKFLFSLVIETGTYLYCTLSKCCNISCSGISIFFILCFTTNYRLIFGHCQGEVGHFILIFWHIFIVFALINQPPNQTIFFYWLHTQQTRMTHEWVLSLLAVWSLRMGRKILNGEGCTPPCCCCQYMIVYTVMYITHVK